jgi:NADPH:quinone reductase-like Zn-dependent oxidoreductase
MAMPNAGALSEYILVKGTDACVPVPSNLSLRDAACVGIAGKTAYDTLYPYVKDLPRGAKVLINGGSGGVGTFALQIAKHLGCYVTTTCSGPNVELCKELGADQVIDYRTEPLVPTLTRAGTQYDLIVDNVMADPYLYWNCHAYLKPEGQFLTIAGGPNLKFLKFMAQVYLIPKFLGGGQRRFGFVGCEAKQEGYERLAQWMAEGSVKAVVERTYTMEECRDAYAKLKTGRVRGKLVVEVSGEK